MDPFDGSNDAKLEVLLIGDSLGFADSRVYGSEECINLGFFYGKFLGTILVNVDGITLKLDF